MSGSGRSRSDAVAVRSSLFDGSFSRQPAHEQPIERGTSRPDDRDHGEHARVRELIEAHEVENAVEFAPLRGENGDGHTDDERDRCQASEEAEHEQRAADELAVCDEDRLKSGRGNAELLEETRHFRDVVNLAPSGRDEEQADGQPSDQWGCPLDLAKDFEHAFTEVKNEIYHGALHIDEYECRVKKLPRWPPSIPAFALGLAFGAACTPPVALSARRSDPPEAVWQYEVHASANDLAVDARFAPGTLGRFEIDDDVAAFVRDVEYASGGRWNVVAADGSTWVVPCAPGCRVRYRFALREAAVARHDVDTAILAGEAIVAPPSTWLLRPADAPWGARFRFRVTSDPPLRFTAGTHPSRDGAADTYEASAAALGQASFAVFGPFHAVDIVRGDARVVVAIAPDGLLLSDAEVADWVGRAVSDIAAYLGRFPADRTLVVVQAGDHGATEGVTLGDTGPAVLVRVGRGIDAAKTRDDWVVTHELLHVSLPSLSREHAWFDEGVATYVEPVVRARAGEITAEKFWGDLVAGVPQGLPEAGDEGLERTHTWGRTYWGGALFCLLADVTLRERTQNARSFDDVLRAVVRTGADVEAHWGMDQVLDVGDRATGAGVMRELYGRLAQASGTVDIEALWSRLGVVRRAGQQGVTFDDRAPLAAVRRAITSPPATRVATAPSTFF